MSVVIIGGNDRMERLYQDTCKAYGCKAKIFLHLKSELRRKIGSPDLMILFTNTVSHKMVNCAMCEARQYGHCPVPQQQSQRPPDHFGAAL